MSTLYLDTKQIAERYELKREYVTDKLTKRADFPKPAINLTRKIRKWAATDVDAFFKKRAKSAH